MNLFKKKIDNSHSNLSVQTSNILGVFRNTMEQLKNVNDAAQNEANRQTAIILAAEEEKRNLEALMVNNEKVIHNINNFLTV